MKTQRFFRQAFLLTLISIIVNSCGSTPTGSNGIEPSTYLFLWILFFIGVVVFYFVYIHGRDKK